MAGTTTNYGISYPTSTDLVKDGAAAIQTVATGFDTVDGGRNCAGLVFIKAQTIGSAVASVSVTGAFSTTYDSYKIVVTGGVASANGNLALKIGGSTTHYAGGILTNYSSGATTTVTSNGTTSWANMGTSLTTGLQSSWEVQNPFLTATTYAQGSIMNGTNSGFVSGYLNDTTSYTAFTVTPSTGTLTGGTIAVYGYRKAI
jgi:hypothetical protein